MARISTYTIDSLVEGSDKLLGTDANSSSALATKNYTIDSLKSYILGNQPSTNNIPDYVPLGYFLSVNREGTAYEKAQVRTLAGSVLTNVVLKSNTVNTGSDIFLNTLGNGQVFLTIRDYNDGQFGLDYDFQAFAENSATFTGVLGGATYTGTVTSFNAGSLTTNSPEPNNSKYVSFPPNKYTDWCFNVTLNEAYTGGMVAFTGFTFLTGIQQVKTQIVGDLEVSKEFVVNNIDLGGNLSIKTSSQSITFGDTAPNVKLSTDGTNLTVTGAGSNLVANSTTFSTNTTAPEFHALNANSTKSVLSSTGVQLKDSSGNDIDNQVAGNISQGTLSNEGYLTSLKVDDKYFSLPALSSGVAEAIPGLTEVLAGPTAGITPGRFFYATQNAAGALFSAATSPASLGSAPAIAAGATSFTVASGDRTDFGNTFDNIPSGKKLYFVSSTYTAAFPSAGGQMLDNSIDMYLVVAYDAGTNVLTFGRQGYGTMNLHTSAFNIDSEVVKLNSIPQATKTNFVFLDPATKALSHNPLSVLGSANGASYTYGGNTDVPVVSIDFGNLQTVAGSNGQVALNQGYAFGGALSASTTVENFKHYILDNIAADRTITLPAGSAGDSIRFTNMSSLDSSGGYSASSYVWTINPNGSEKIMRSTTLVLDESTASFELFYSNATNGWIVNGIN